MKSIKYIISAITILIAIIVYKTTMVDCDGCGGCSYSQFEGMVKVDTIHYNLKTDSIDYCILKSDTSKALFYFDKYDIYSQKGVLNSKLITDSETKFFIKGNYITTGTCTPYNIDTIYLIKK